MFLKLLSPKRSLLYASLTICCLFPQTGNLSGVSLTKKRSLLSETKGTHIDSQGTLVEINNALTKKREELFACYSSAGARINELLEAKASQELINQATQEEILRINALQTEILNLEDKWKDLSEGANPQDIDALWHQPDATVAQLVIDYGAHDCVYVIPPEIGSLKIHVSSQMAIPKALWGEMLELVLAGYGIGIKQVSPFLKQLTFIRLNNSGIFSITDSKDEIALLPEDSKVAFVLTPEPSDVRRITQFLDKFAPLEQVTIQQTGGSILMIGLVRELTELLKIASFISGPKMANTWRLISLQKANSEEMARMLSTLFETEGGRSDSSGNMGGSEKHAAPTFGADQSQGFKVVVLKHPSQSLFLVGTKELIDKAVKIIEDVEATIGDVQERSIYWYACKNSEAEDLAKVLSQVYTRLLGLTTPAKSGPQQSIRVGMVDAKIRNQEPSPATVVNAPPLIAPATMDKTKTANLHENFIIDAKTNSIVMVVENYVLPKLKELVRKLDVPKQMVQIDVMLFEKRIGDSSSFGMNLLRMGSAASKKHKDSIIWNDAHRDKLHGKHKHKKHHKNEDHRGHEIGKGLFEYIISRGPTSIMPFDLVFQFLLTQENIQINANPSVTTVNQTPAKIAVVDQISINTGAVEFTEERVKDSYTRAEYGITIQITPTIHSKLDDDEHEPQGQKFITMSTDIIFDTTKPSKHDRPDVTRRNVKNEVRVADGETVIIGGLRRKTEHGDQESIPFLGELPGIGKLFSTTALTSHSTEMFVFITPRIVPDASEEMKRLRKADLAKRPGDTPEFMKEVLDAQKREKRALFERSLEMLFKTPDQIS